LFYSELANSQTVENEFQTQMEFDMSWKLAKKLKLSVIPELRFNEPFVFDKFLFETQLAYKPIKLVELGGSYKLIANRRENNPTEFLSKFAFDATVGKNINRWDPSFRIRYTNDTEDDSNNQFFRYKAKLEYNLKNCKLTPAVAVEGFQELATSELYKMRYSANLGYKLNKKNSIALGYKFDYYMQDFLNKHTLYLGYKIKF
jgi:hypothetical protein